ncbi:alpha/beta fold hydrolase [Polymorphobacter sp.]|uniref:alpha/beta hydrolase n=1 Tax=Polymorphobacter sp. TaxID=1909290 RepID=UPI003F70DD24
MHYRRAGEGPPLLLAHQSPRSSAEYIPLLEQWSAHFTCIAPDTAGFGESAPLPMAAPDVQDYADALLAFLDAIGLARCGAYGFHSGAIILAAAAKRAPERFWAVVAEGYAMWTDAERADFGANYTPPYTMTAYGEHLTWTWHRIREQSWFFPWYATEDSHRLPHAHDDVQQNHEMVMDVLAAGPSYALGYAAVLQAPRDLPGPGQASAPTLVSGYDGDPMKAHIDRIEALPEGWATAKCVLPAEAKAAALDWLMPRAEPGHVLPRAPDDEGFAMVPDWGQLHWIGDRAAGHVHLHAPGSAAEFVVAPGMLAIDLPGHGMSDGFVAAPSLDALVDVLVGAIEPLVTAPLVRVTGEGASARLAGLVAARLGLAVAPVPERALAGWPDLTPDRFGSHLTRAWGFARAEAAFDPWDAPSKANARPVQPGVFAPERLHRRVLAALRARHVPEMLAALGG